MIATATSNSFTAAIRFPLFLSVSNCFVITHAASPHYAKTARPPSPHQPEDNPASIT